jgi:hypothetical protein
VQETNGGSQVPDNYQIYIGSDEENLKIEE